MRLPRWLAPALWAAFILVMATDLGSGENTGAVLDPFLEWLGLGASASAFLHGAFRALGHATAYGVFALLALRALPSTLPRRVGLALLLALLLALVDEGLQALAVPSRTGDGADVLLDGGAAALVLLWASRRTARATGSAAPAP